MYRAQKPFVNMIMMRCLHDRKRDFSQLNLVSPILLTNVPIGLDEAINHSGEGHMVIRTWICVCLSRQIGLGSFCMGLCKIQHVYNGKFTNIVRSGGAAICSPVFAVVAYLYMEFFQDLEVALSSAPVRPILWMCTWHARVWRASHVEGHCGGASWAPELNKIWPSICPSWSMRRTC